MLRKEAREIEMMLETKKTVLEIYGAEMKSADGDFSMKTEPTKLDKPVVTEVSNPDVVGVLSTYHHLKGAEIAGISKNEQLPIHLVLGAGHYNAIKPEEPQRVGKPGEPTAEKTRFEWTLMAPGKGERSGRIYFDSYENELLDKLIKEGKRKLARKFNLSYRYIDDLISFNFSTKRFKEFISDIYPKELTISEITVTTSVASYFDLLFTRDKSNNIIAKLYDKRDTFGFHIVNFLFMSSIIPSAPVYGVYKIMEYIRLKRTLH